MGVWMRMFVSLCEEQVIVLVYGRGYFVFFEVGSQIVLWMWI